MISYEQGFRKVSHKSRSGRRARPVGHRDHRKRRAGSRAARLLKREFMLRFAPTVEEHDVFVRPVASGVHVQVMFGALGLTGSYREAPRAGVTAAGRDQEVYS